MMKVRKFKSIRVYSRAALCLLLAQVISRRGASQGKEHHTQCHSNLSCFICFYYSCRLCSLFLCFFFSLYRCIISCSVFSSVFQPLLSSVSWKAFDVLLLLKQLNGSSLWILAVLSEHNLVLKEKKKTPCLFIFHLHALLSADPFFLFQPSAHSTALSLFPSPLPSCLCCSNNDPVSFLWHFSHCHWSNKLISCATRA